MAKDHSHPEPVKCSHDLGWCAKCERPYCKTCGKEWHEQSDTSIFKKLGNWPEPQPWRQNPIPMWPEPSRPLITWEVPPRQFTGPVYPPGTVLCEHRA